MKSVLVELLRMAIAANCDKCHHDANEVALHLGPDLGRRVLDVRHRAHETAIPRDQTELDRDQRQQQRDSGRFVVAPVGDSRGHATCPQSDHRGIPPRDRRIVDEWSNARTLGDVELLLRSDPGVVVVSITFQLGN
ncbi:MAG: hypothetical protein ABIR32_16160 [Ilumatobacteraceae bacterium]